MTKALFHNCRHSRIENASQRAGDIWPVHFILHSMWLIQLNLCWHHWSHVFWQNLTMSVTYFCMEIRLYGLLLLWNRKCLRPFNFCICKNFWSITKIEHTNISMSDWLSTHQQQEAQRYIFARLYHQVKREDCARKTFLFFSTRVKGSKVNYQQ